MWSKATIAPNIDLEEGKREAAPVSTMRRGVSKNRRATLNYQLIDGRVLSQSIDCEPFYSDA